MKLRVRVGIAVLIGWAFYTMLLLTAGSAEISESIKSWLLWNVPAFVALAGNGPILGQDANGAPIYEGTPVHFLFFIIGLTSGFGIYPLIVFGALTIWSRIKARG